MMTFYKVHLENDQINFLHARSQLGVSCSIQSISLQNLHLIQKANFRVSSLNIMMGIT